MFLILGPRLKGQSMVFSGQMAGAQKDEQKSVMPLNSLPHGIAILIITMIIFIIIIITVLNIGAGISKPITGLCFAGFPHNHPARQVLLLSLFYSWGNQSPESFRTYPRSHTSALIFFKAALLRSNLHTVIWKHLQRATWGSGIVPTCETITTIKVVIVSRVWCPWAPMMLRRGVSFWDFLISLCTSPGLGYPRLSRWSQEEGLGMVQAFSRLCPLLFPSSRPHFLWHFLWPKSRILEWQQKLIPGMVPLARGTHSTRKMRPWEENNPSREHLHPTLPPEASWGVEPATEWHCGASPNLPLFSCWTLLSLQDQLFCFHIHKNFLTPCGPHFASGELAVSS